MLPDPLPEERTIEHKGIEMTSCLTDDLAKELVEKLMRDRHHMKLAGRNIATAVQMSFNGEKITVVIRGNKMKILEVE